MKVALVNASPKAKNSASGFLQAELKGLLSGCSIADFHFPSAEQASHAGEILGNDAIVFMFPLYIDGAPSHLLSCLKYIENALTGSGDRPMVYAVSNCGFYEGHQNRHALSIIRNWCLKSGARLGQGVGIGAGGMLPSLNKVPAGLGPRKNVTGALMTLARNIEEGRSGENIFASPNFPRFLYKIAAEKTWRMIAKRNGLKPRELANRY